MNLTELIRAIIDRNICTRQSSDDNKRLLTEAIVKAIPKREHGKWIRQSWGYECSKCHEFIEGGWDNEANSMKPFANFCPHCGADMTNSNAVEEPTDDCIAIEFPTDINEPSKWQSKDGQWHTSKIPTKAERSC